MDGRRTKKSLNGWNLFLDGTALLAEYISYILHRPNSVFPVDLNSFFECLHACLLVLWSVFFIWFFSWNGVFFSQQISWNSISTYFFSEVNGIDEHEPGKWHAEAERPLSQPHRPKLSIFLFYYRTSEADLWRCSMRNALKGRYRLSKLQKDVDIISRFGDLCISGDGLLWKVWFFFVLFFIVLRDSDLGVVLVQACARLAVAMQSCR